jgi:hypothetical protein
LLSCLKVIVAEVEAAGRGTSERGPHLRTGQADRHRGVAPVPQLCRHLTSCFLDQQDRAFAALAGRDIDGTGGPGHRIVTTLPPLRVMVRVR